MANPSKFLHYSLLLYPDNSVHMKAFKIIRRSSDLSQYYIGIWHIQRNDDGSEIIKDEGKKHLHLYFIFPNQRSYKKLQDDLGLDDQFLRPMFFNPKTGKYREKKDINASLVYLFHRNRPHKEQYDITDAFGSVPLILKAEKALREYESRNCSMQDAVQHAIKWIMGSENRGTIVTAAALVRFLANSPYWKASQHWAVRECMQSHNAALYQSLERTVMDEEVASINEAYYKYQERKISALLGDIDDYEAI